jgi:hypothetical protein
VTKTRRAGVAPIVDARRRNLTFRSRDHSRLAPGCGHPGTPCRYFYHFAAKYSRDTCLVAARDCCKRHPKPRIYRNQQDPNVTPTGSEQQQPGGNLDALREGAYREAKRYLPIFIYFWVLLALFGLHRCILLTEESILYTQAFAILNAFVMAKVLFFGEALQLGENFRNRPLIYPVLFKSALFAVLLLCFDIIEEIVKGTLSGKTLSESIAGTGGGTLEGITAVGVIIFVVLTPFFAFREMTRVIGARELRELFFVRWTKLEPVSPASPRSPGNADNA